MRAHPALRTMARYHKGVQGAMMKRRSVIQWAVGYIKMDQRLSRSPINGPAVTRYRD